MFRDLKRALFRDRLAEFIGREPHPSGAGKAIYHMQSPRHAQFRFEWHPQKRRVYLIRIGLVPEIGEVVAFDIETHGDAINAVNIFLRGFREGQQPGVKPHLFD